MGIWKFGTARDIFRSVAGCGTKGTERKDKLRYQNLRFVFFSPGFGLKWLASVGSGTFQGMMLSESEVTKQLTDFLPASGRDGSLSGSSSGRMNA